jgi:hypothetical protein
MPTPEKEGTRFNVYEYTASTPQSFALLIWSGQSRSVLVTRSTLDTRYYWVESVLNGVERRRSCWRGHAGARTPAESFIARGNCYASGTTITKVGGIGGLGFGLLLARSLQRGLRLEVQGRRSVWVVHDRPELGSADDQNYTSLDHAWYIDGAGAAYIFENGANILFGGGFTTADVFSISYDALTVRYYINGILKREVANPGKVFFLDSSFNAPDSIAVDVFFGPLSSQPSARMISRGQCVVVGTRSRRSAERAPGILTATALRRFPAGVR